ncbi:secreted RxLR effector protein 161-like [Lactuca sativa]|uniref:secreted RxLR effector protein 161-like n=1 Tax=Lactuca sativa TaxID=4236 RepID=UPI0022AF2772|nr:secreted RxLR effector protein 161-like [Lactuca sativa]
MYFRKQGDAGIMLVSLYVDDMIYTGSSKELIYQFKMEMMKTFEMTDLGKLHYFLGIDIKQTNTGIFIAQEKYVSDMLKGLNMENIEPVTTPMNTNEKITCEDATGMTDPQNYRSIVGRLIYRTHTRPDISFVVGVVSRFMHKPTKQHYGAVKRIIRYLASTKHYGIWYLNSKRFVLKGYNDSDWAGSQEDKKSTIGNCFSTGSGIISWQSKKQATVALSSTEAEYVAVTITACQAVWLRKLIGDLM